MSDLVFLDTETTGLEPEKHEVWEIAWAFETGGVRSMILPHDLRKADPKALQMNGYYDRCAQGVDYGTETRNDLYIRGLLEGNTLVCANPTFDRMFLRKRWGLEPWHYRSLDIESMAFVVLGYDRPKGLKDISGHLRLFGYAISAPDHSAAGDVKVLRECYNALLDIRGKMNAAYLKDGGR